ncbi:MAG: glycoside hydrolase family protein [Candidatus Cloacimonetes bacterium]|nr:glycoside hydrolase family protein [Candidatus Cloacimonadota bacterium]
MNFDRVKERLRKAEGLRLKPYVCPAGKLTIGYGRNIQDKGISIGEAEYLLDNDVKNAYKELKQNLPWVENLSENRQIVLLDMCFNLGMTGLLGFKHTLSLIEKGDYLKASQEMLKSKWAKQVGKRAVELSDLMRLG